MIKEARGFGSTIDEAKEKAILELGASELDDIQFDVISMPKKKVLGIFGGNEAEVRAFIELPDEKPKIKKGAPKKEKKEKSEATLQKAESKPKAKKSDPVFGEAVDESEIDKQSPAGKAVAYLKGILGELGYGNAVIKVALGENSARILISGEDLSIIIGRRGETLDAVQYLASLVANNGGGRYKISLNVGNYRERREEALIGLANKVAEQVKSTKKSRTLEPMNPYERRIIHTAIQEIEGVVSTSFGEGSGRRVVVSLEGAQVRPPRLNNKRRSQRDGRPARNSSKAVASDPAREPKKDTDIPLYGKIN